MIGESFMARTTVHNNNCRCQVPLKWEHKASNEDKWSEYSPGHSALLTQVNMLLNILCSSASTMGMYCLNSSRHVVAGSDKWKQ